LLRNTFIHIPQIGIVTERKLWDSGIQSWKDWCSSAKAKVRQQHICNVLDWYVPLSLERLAAKDAGFFQNLMPACELWRIYPEFSDNVAFLDIETTGLGQDDSEITLIGLYNGKNFKVFVRGQNLGEFADEIANYSVVITYNGTYFDLPFLRNEFKSVTFPAAHIDLRFLAKRLGYTGGLKGVEIQLGILRPEELRGIDGYVAVLLWQEYLEGTKEALDALIMYNREDVVNLRYIMERCYNQAIKELPLEVEPIPVREIPSHDTGFTPGTEFIERLRSAVGAHRY
jgi:uncharacterized protein YprB with RNaseH-like and TPR domain